MRFVNKFGVDFADDRTCMLPTEATKNRVKRSVNGFIMESYCELLGRRCTREEMERHLEYWPDPNDSEALAQGAGECTDEQVIAGMQTPLNQDCSVALGPTGQRILSEAEGVFVPFDAAESIFDPDRIHRERVRRDIRTSEEYLRGNLARMIMRVLNRVAMNPGWQRTSEPVTVWDWLLIGQEVDYYLDQYHQAVHADYYFGAVPLDPVTGLRAEAKNHQAEFGRFLYSNLCGRYGIDPMTSFSRDKRLVIADFFTWYLTFDDGNIPGPGPFDVYAPHLNVGPCDVDWETYLESGPWEYIPGSLHGIWKLRGADAENYIRENLRDAGEAGIDILLISSWLRPGGPQYPWMPQGGCRDQDWWSCKCGDDLLMPMIVRILNELKAEGHNTPKIGLMIEPSAFAPNIKARKQTHPNYHPLGWAACVYNRGYPAKYTAYWDKDEDPAVDDFQWRFAFPEAQRYLASFIRTFFQEVPLEHMAVIDRKAVCGVWKAGDGVIPAYTDTSQPAKTVSDHFSEEFYGLRLWFIASEEWARDTERDNAIHNDFVYEEPWDPWDRHSDPVRVGDMYIDKGSSYQAVGPGLGGSYDGMTMYALGPGCDMTRKRWYHGGDTTGKAEVSLGPGELTGRKFGFTYFDNWLQVISEGLSLGKPVRLKLTSWNELYEGAGLCRSPEYDDAYILLTRAFSDIWRGEDIRTDRDWLIDFTYRAFAGRDSGARRSSIVEDLPWEPSWSLRRFWSRIGQKVSTEEAIMCKHPALLATTRNVGEWVRPVEREQRRAAGRIQSATWFLPLTLVLVGTGKHAGETAYIWVKFLSNTYKSEDWRIVTNPDTSPGADQGGVRSMSRLVEMVEDTDGVLYGFIIEDRGNTSGNYQHNLNRMHRPTQRWKGYPADPGSEGCEPLVFPLTIPEYDAKGFKILNVVIDGFEDESLNYVHLGGSYVLSGDPVDVEAGTRSWVHLEPSYLRVDLRVDRSNVPRTVDPSAIPPDVRILGCRAAATVIADRRKDDDQADET